MKSEEKINLGCVLYAYIGFNWLWKSHERPSGVLRCIKDITDFSGIQHSKRYSSVYRRHRSLPKFIGALLVFYGPQKTYKSYNVHQSHRQVIFSKIYRFSGMYRRLNGLLPPKKRSRPLCGQQKVLCYLGSIEDIVAL